MSRRIRHSLLIAWIARLAWLGALLAALLWVMGRAPFDPPMLPVSDEAARMAIERATGAKVNRAGLTKGLFAAEKAGDAPAMAQYLAMAGAQGITLPEALANRARPLAEAVPPLPLPAHPPRLAQVMGDRLPVALFVLGDSAAHYLNRPNPAAVLTIALAALALIAAWLLLHDLAIMTCRLATRRQSRALTVAGPRILRDHELT